jgi:hypothetical protein
LAFLWFMQDVYMRNTILNDKKLALNTIYIYILGNFRVALLNQFFADSILFKFTIGILGSVSISGD